MTQTRRPSVLPEFGNPPVTEVVMGIQFEELNATTLDGVRLAERFPGLPKLTEHAPLAPTFEVFGHVQGAIPRLELLPDRPMQRLWFKSEDGQHLVQFQRDRLIRNWMKSNENIEYPRYEAMRASYLDDVQTVQRFAKEKDLGEIKPNQCEITYINTIEIPGEQAQWAHLEKILRIWSDDFVDGEGMQIEDATVGFRYALIASEGEPYGRLTVGVGPVRRVSDGAPLVQMSLTVRGRPKVATVEASFDFLDEGRYRIVTKFTSLTRPEMHKIWKKKK